MSLQTLTLIQEQCQPRVGIEADQVYPAISVEVSGNDEAIDSRGESPGGRECSFPIAEQDTDP